MKWNWRNFFSYPLGGIHWFHWSVVGGSAGCPSVKNVTWAVSIVPRKTRVSCTGLPVVHDDTADVTQCGAWLFDSVWGLTGPSLWLYEPFLTLCSSPSPPAGCTVTRQSRLPLGTTTGHRHNLCNESKNWAAPALLKTLTDFQVMLLQLQQLFVFFFFLPEKLNLVSLRLWVTPQQLPSCRRWF